jgi:hypothetical protein
MSVWPSAALKQELTARIDGEAMDALDRLEECLLLSRQWPGAGLARGGQRAKRDSLSLVVAVPVKWLQPVLPETLPSAANAKGRLRRIDHSGVADAEDVPFAPDQRDRDGRGIRLDLGGGRRLTADLRLFPIHKR